MAAPSVTSRSEATFVSTHDRLRGVNIAQPFANWQKGLPWNLARGWNVWLPPERLAAIASAQFEFIRICVDPAPLLAAETADALDAGINTVTRAIDSALQAGIKVIFDVHVSMDHPTWNIHSLTDGPRGNNFLRLVKVETRVAEAVAARYSPHSVALELFNEPPPSSDFITKAPWPEQLAFLYESVRTIAPKHTLLLSGTNFSSIDGLTTLDPSGFDRNIVWVFHFYEPVIFCYQGLNSWYFKYVHHLHFPPRLDDRALLERATTLMGQDSDLARDFTESLRRYVETPQDEVYIRRRLALVGEWADRNGVPPNRVICGEFGSFGDIHGEIGAASSDQAAWLRSVRRGVEDLGFNWCVHDLDESFRITDDRGRFVPEMLNALGLHAPS